MFIRCVATREKENSSGRARLAMQEGEFVERRVRAQRVARRLFQDDVDQDQNQNQNHSQDRGQNHVDNLANQLAEEAKRRWNFDFVNEKPLPGVWEWEKVEPKRTIRNDDENREVIRET